MIAIREDLNVNFRCFMDYKGIVDGEEVSVVDYIFFIEDEVRNFCKENKVRDENVDYRDFSEWLQERHLRKYGN